MRCLLLCPSGSVFGWRCMKVVVDVKGHYLLNIQFKFDFKNSTPYSTEKIMLSLIIMNLQTFLSSILRGKFFQKILKWFVAVSMLVYYVQQYKMNSLVMFIITMWNVKYLLIFTTHAAGIKHFFTMMHLIFNIQIIFLKFILIFYSSIYIKYTE